MVWVKVLIFFCEIDYSYRFIVRIPMIFFCLNKNMMIEFLKEL